MAPSIEYPSRVNYHARRMHFSGHHSLGLNLHPALCENHAVESARDYHALPFDLPLDFCVLAEDYRLLRNDISLDMPVDPERPRQRQGAFQRHTLVNEPGPFFASPVFRSTRPLPSHKMYLPGTSRCCCKCIL